MAQEQTLMTKLGDFLGRKFALVESDCRCKCNSGSGSGTETGGGSTEEGGETGGSTETDIYRGILDGVNLSGDGLDEYIEASVAYEYFSDFVDDVKSASKAVINVSYVANGKKSEKNIFVHYSQFSFCYELLRQANEIGLNLNSFDSELSNTNWYQLLNILKNNNFNNLKNFNVVYGGKVKQKKISIGSQKFTSFEEKFPLLDGSDPSLYIRSSNFSPGAAYDDILASTPEITASIGVQFLLYTIYYNYGVNIRKYFNLKIAQSLAYLYMNKGDLSYFKSFVKNEELIAQIKTDVGSLYDLPIVWNFTNEPFIEYTETE